MLHYDDVSLFSVTLALFLIMDPVGNIPSFLKMAQDIPPARQRFIILRELLIAMTVMIVFNYIGEYIYQFLEIEDTSVRIASGIVLFLIAIKILFSAKDSVRANITKGEPFVVPLAIPLLAGPATLATIMLFAHMTICQPMMLTAIVLASFASMIVLLSSPWLKRVLGDNGLSACEKLMGMVLVFLAIQRLFEGIQQFVLTSR